MKLKWTGNVYAANGVQHIKQIMPAKGLLQTGVPPPAEPPCNLIPPFPRQRELLLHRKPRTHHNIFIKEELLPSRHPQVPLKAGLCFMWPVAIPVFIAADSLASRDIWRWIYFGSCLLPPAFSPQRVYSCILIPWSCLWNFSLLTIKKKRCLILFNHLSPVYFLLVCTNRHIGLNQILSCC